MCFFFFFNYIPHFLFSLLTNYSLHTIATVEGQSEHVLPSRHVNCRITVSCNTPLENLHAWVHSCIRFPVLPWLTGRRAWFTMSNVIYLIYFPEIKCHCPENIPKWVWHPPFHYFYLPQDAISLKPWLLFPSDSLCDALCCIALQAICGISGRFVSEWKWIWSFFPPSYPINHFLLISAWYHYWISDWCHL